jgi:nucleotide-binding universal stress UspA family protein
MYRRILVPLEHSAYDQVILTHVRPLAQLCTSSIVLIHVADGWAARHQLSLKLRESEEMRLDREYIEACCASLRKIPWPSATPRVNASIEWLGGCFAHALS